MNNPTIQSSAKAVRPAVFLDRDGVLNIDQGFVHRIADFEWVENAPAAVKALNEAGWLVFVVTNQSGVARAMYAESDVIGLHDWMNHELAKFGAHIDAFAYCPHHPEATVDVYRQICACRKPAPGMLTDLMTQWPVDRDRSIMIGDRDVDMTAAKAAGVVGHLFSGGDLLAFIRQIGLI